MVITSRRKGWASWGQRRGRGEEVPDFVHQDTHVRERFEENVRRAQPDAEQAFGQIVFHRAGEDDELESRIVSVRPQYEFVPVHVGQAHVHNAHIRLTEMQLVQAIFGVGGCNDPILLVFQKVGEREAQEIFILDDQYDRQG